MNDYFNIELYKSTKEDWCPNYKIGYHNVVKVNFEVVYLDDDKITYLVCVWGLDDLGMELFDDDLEKMEKIFLEIVKKDYITFEFLTSLGLQRA